MYEAGGFINVRRFQLVQALPRVRKAMPVALTADCVSSAVLGYQHHQEVRHED